MKTTYNKNFHIVLMSYHKPSMPWLVEYLKKNRIKKIAYVMNAAKRELDKNPNFIYNDKGKLDEAGFETEVINLDNEGSLPERLSDFDVIYVRGGNTFDLLDSVRKSGFDKLLPKLLKQGVAYVSSSAGSILLSPSIEIAENDFLSDQNIVGLSDKSGLGIVDFAVFPHWEDKYETKFQKFAANLQIKYPVIKLKDNQVILIENGKMKINEVASGLGRSKF